ncbi:MAG: outer membrane beta-barrel family protein, partial [Muribaculaceae bacterium]|nr:outer membrane beta-barrel family protein [Muribaculaceae bacterium]
RDVNFVGVSARTDAEADFAARERRVVRSYGVGESLSLNYTFRRNRVSVFGNVMMNDYRSRDTGFSDFVSWTANYGGTAVLNLPYDWSVSTDLTMYMRRGYNDRRLNTTDLLWNARVAKTVFKGRVVLAADAYDILRQLSNVTYLVSALSRTETVSNVVPSYVLFHVQYRFNLK